MRDTCWARHARSRAGRVMRDTCWARRLSVSRATRTDCLAACVEVVRLARPPFGALSALGADPFSCFCDHSLADLAVVMKGLIF
eukprot:351729-Chlamydomonas_euryale.AAC.2